MEGFKTRTQWWLSIATTIGGDQSTSPRSCLSLVCCGTELQSRTRGLGTPHCPTAPWASRAAWRPTRRSRGTIRLCTSSSSSRSYAAAKDGRSAGDGTMHSRRRLSRTWERRSGRGHTCQRSQCPLSCDFGSRSATQMCVAPTAQYPESYLPTSHHTLQH